MSKVFNNFTEWEDLDRYFDLKRTKPADMFEQEFHGRYEQEFLTTSVYDKLRLEDMQNKIMRLEDQIGRSALAKEIITVENIDLKKMNEELIEENQKLKIEINKIYSRFDILDL